MSGLTSNPFTPPVPPLVPLLRCSCAGQSRRVHPPSPNCIRGPSFVLTQNPANLSMLAHRPALGERRSALPHSHNGPVPSHCAGRVHHLLRACWVGKVRCSRSPHLKHATSCSTTRPGNAPPVGYPERVRKTLLSVAPKARPYPAAPHPCTRNAPIVVMGAHSLLP